MKIDIMERYTAECLKAGRETVITSEKSLIW